MKKLAVFLVLGFSGLLWGADLGKCELLYLTVSDKPIENATVSGGIGNYPGITVTAPATGKVVPLLNAAQKKYLALPREERISFFADKDKRAELVKAGYYPEKVTLAWKLSDSKAKNVTVTISEKPDFCPAISIPVQNNKTSIKLGNLKIAQDYYWQVTAESTSGKIGSPVVSFRTEDIAPRLIRVNGVPNFRDVGGRVGLNGKRVRQGMIFRSAGWNDNASGDPEKGNQKPGKNRLSPLMATYITDYLGIKTELDLRNDKECFGMNGSPAGEKINYVHISSSQYGYMQRAFGRGAFKKDFELFLDPQNYPISFHCISGQDRTGALAFILNGLLGVSEEELYLDWESTGFWNKSARFNHARLFNHLIEGFDQFPGKTINEKIEGYVRSVGFTDEDIAKFRSIMLE